MAKVVEMKKYRKNEEIDKILLYCIDNDFETRYITAEFEKRNLLIKFTHFCHYMKDADINFVLKFSPKQTKTFIELFAKNKSDFLHELKNKFNSTSACQDIIKFANNHCIKYKYADVFFLYDFGDVYEDIPLLYYKDGSLIVPTLYKHPKNGVAKIYLPSGYLYMEISYKNNLKDGLTKCYFENSKQINWEQNYTKDKLDGITKNYYKNGKLHREETFVNGVKEGWETLYNEAGYIEEKQMYAKNDENGLAIKYYPNGQIKHEAYFKNGKQDGITKKYYESGELELISYWKNDKQHGLKVTYHKNGNICAISTAKNGEYAKPEYQYYEDGTLEAILPAKDTGIELVYYPNGNLKYEKELKRGKKCGKIKWYYDDNRIEYDYNYKNDKRHGICREYHHSGKLRIECEYKNGKKNGIEKRYYNSGQLSHEHSYKNGLRDGYSISYKEKTGEIVYKVLYRQGKLIDYCENDGIIGVKNLDLKEE